MRDTEYYGTTSTETDTDFPGSVTLVAVMVAVPVDAGAENNPVFEIDPIEADQVTAFDEDPVTFASI